MVPPVLTCLIGRTLGTGIGALDHYDLRDLAAALLGHLCDKYSRYSHNLKPRLARSCLKTFLDPKKSHGSHYGAILGLRAIGGAEVVRQLVLPNVKAFGELLEDAIQESSVKNPEVEKVVTAVMVALGTLVDDDIPMMNGHSGESAANMRMKLIDKFGEVVGGRIADSANTRFARAVLEGDLGPL